MSKLSMIAMLAVTATVGLVDTDAEASHRRRGRRPVVMPYGSPYSYGYLQPHGNHYHVRPAPVVVPHSHNCAPPAYYHSHHHYPRGYRSSSSFYLRTPRFSVGIRR